MNNIKYIFSDRFVTSNYESSRFINQDTSEEFEFSEFLLSLIKYFEKPMSIDDFMLSNNITKRQLKKWNEVIDDLIDKKVLIAVDDQLIDRPLYVELSTDNDVASYIARAGGTMFGCPSVKIDNIHKGDFVLFGLPIDVGCTEKTGTKFGPQSFRNISISQYAYSENLLGYPRGIFDEKHGALMCGVKIKDLGDVLFFPGENPEDYTKKITKVNKIISKNKCIPIAIGGDHSISYGAIAGLIKKNDDFVILHFDAHTDLGELYKNRHHHHGNVFARVLRDFPNSRIAQFGIRGQAGQKPDNSDRYILGSSYSPNEWNNEWRKFVTQKSKVYISLDIDVTDPLYAPGVGTPVRNGIHPENLIDNIKSMSSGLSIVGIDIVELNPVYDNQDVTSKLACEYLMNILSNITI